MIKNKTSHWFLPLRLTQYIIISAVMILWLKFPATLNSYFIVYSILTLFFTILFALEKKIKYDLLKITLISFQFICELLIVSKIIYLTGHINSPFSVLFVLTIISAALIYRLIGSLIMTTLVSTAYAFIVWLAMGWSGDTPITLNSFKTITSAEDSVFFAIFLHLLIYYLVAFISGYLAERIKDRDRQLADTSLALKKARLETDDILRHLNSGLLTVDASGKIIFFNRAAERILGFLETDVKGMHCDDVFSERMPQLAEDILKGIHSRKELPRKELNVINAEGNSIPLGFSTSVLTEENDQLRGIIAIFTDLTKAKSLEAKVRAADRLAAIGELSASIAHEIRNPLAAISGSVQVLKNEIELHGDNKRLMSLIIKESDRLTELLNDFLAYARIDRPVFGKVELVKLISEVIEIVKHHHSFNNQINISCVTGYQSVFVIADEGMVKQLLINLAVNACEAFNGSGGEIIFKLSSNTESKRAILEVIDNGPGIEITEIHNIYKPFYSTKNEGTGLGLSIVQRICNILKLPITTGTPDNGGTVFKIDFLIENVNLIDTVNENQLQKNSSV